MYDTWTLLIATVTSVVCAICGCLLLVNRRAMVSEGLSHAVLPGLVIAFIFVRDITSPWLIVSAAASGMVMVWLTQALQRTGLVEPDAGLGIVFAGMFSAGILLVSLELENVHFHADCIIDGDIPLTDGVNGQQVTQVLEAAEESLANDGRAVLLPGHQRVAQQP